MNYATLHGEEKVPSLFHADPAVPSQFFETFRKKVYIEPEKRLMLAVLEEAIKDLQKYLPARSGKGKRMFRDAEDWILDDDGDSLFSFRNICEVLGLSPDYVRYGLTGWKQGSPTPLLKAHHREPGKRTSKTYKVRVKFAV